MGPSWTRSTAVRGLLVITGLLFVWVAGRDAWSANVRAGLHETYGRLVFDWGKPVRYSFSISGTRATLTFGEPVVQDPAQVINRIDPYVAAVTLSSDRKTAIVTLREPFQTQVFTVGDAVVFDFSKNPDSSSSGTSSKPQPQPPSPPRKPDAPPSLPKQNTDAEPQKSSPADQNSAPSSPGSTPPPRVSTPSSQEPDPSAQGEKASEPKTELKVQTSPSEGFKAKKTARERPSVSARGVDVFVSTQGRDVRLTLQWSKRPRYSVRRGKNAVTLTFPTQATIDQNALRAALPKELRTAEVISGPRRLSVKVPVPEGAELTTGIEGNRVLVDIRLPEVRQDDPTADKTATQMAPEASSTGIAQNSVSSPPSASAGAKGAASRPSAAAQVLEKAMRARLGLPEPVAPSEPPPPLPREPGAVGEVPQVEPTEAEERPAIAASLSFPWNQPTAAAVFRRGGWVWVVFDRPQELDLGLLRRLGGQSLKIIEQIPSRSATVVRMLIEPGFNPSVRREGLLWVVDILRQPWRPSQPATVEPQPRSPVGPRLFIPVSEGGRAMVLEDPEVGDRFITVPLITLGVGIYPSYKFPDVDIPTTVQGILVEPRTDRIVVNSTRNGVDVTARGGLAFSPNLAQVKLLANVGANTDLKRVLDIERWMYGPEEDYDKNRKDLQLAVANAPPSRRSNARLDFARFFFAHGRAAEALGILKVLERDNPDMVNTGAFRALRGVSSFLMGRYPEAAEDLEHSSLSDSEEADFWRAAALAETGEPGLQAQTLRAYGGVIGTYPRRVKIPLALVSAKSAVDVNDEIGANTFLTAARYDDNTARESAAINYLEGKLAQSKGNYDVALERYQDAIDAEDRYYTAVASYDLLTLQKRIDEIDTPTLIEGLERLRYAWRGGGFEFQLLMTLGKLEKERDNYREALNVWQQVATYFQDFKEAEKATSRMRETFQELFLGGAADGMGPVSAIALYDEFRELTPTDEDGDEMIRRLADRLVGVDLLSQAASLLDRQVTYRLEGIDKSRVGARLALVNLLDKKPQKAIESLLKTDDPGTPSALEAQRQRLLARALSDMGRSTEAVELLARDTSSEADLLRTEIYWKQKDWPSVAKMLERLTPEPGLGLVLTEEQARLVLDWATALTLAQDERGILDLRRLYMPAMRKTAYHSAFDLITTTPEGGLIDYRTVSERIKQAEGFRSFMAGYEERLKNLGLSTIN